MSAIQHSMIWCGDRRMLRTWSQPDWQTQQGTKRDLVSNKVEGKDAHPRFLSDPLKAHCYIYAHNHAHKDTILHEIQSVSPLTVPLGLSYVDLTKMHISLELFEFPSEPGWSTVSVLGWAQGSWFLAHFSHTSLFIVFPSGHGWDHACLFPLLNF